MNTIQFKDIQNLNITKDLKTNFAILHNLTNQIKSNVLKDQILRAALSCSKNLTSYASKVDAGPSMAIKSCFTAYGSSREVVLWLSLLTDFKILKAPDTEPLKLYFQELCYTLIKLINNTIETNNIVWTTKSKTKIFYHNSESLNLFVNLEALATCTYDLIKHLPSDALIEWIIGSSTSIVAQLEEGMAYKQYYEARYIKFLQDALKQNYATLSNLELLVATAEVDSHFNINKILATHLIQEYTRTAKTFCALINNTQKRYIEEEAALKAYKKQLKTKNN